LSLPRGIWYEAGRGRYRIRRYRNGRSYLHYRLTEDEALVALATVDEQLSKIKKMRREERRAGPVPVSSFSGMLFAAQLTMQ
jgi:hypothetical protein